MPFQKTHSVQTLRSILDAQALGERISHIYPLSKPICCTFIRWGINDTYRVITENGEYFLRVYTNGNRSRNEILSELRFLDGLYSKGISVAVAARRHDHSQITRFLAPEGVRYAVLFNKAPGTSTKCFCSKEAINFGQTVSKFHNAADKLGCRYERFHWNVDFILSRSICVLRPMLKHRFYDYSFLVRVQEKLARILEALPKTRQMYGMCHGDLQTKNVYSDAKGHLTLLDFDFCGYGWRAFDLAVFLYEYRRASRDIWRSFLDGYRSRREFTDQEEKAVGLFVAAYHIWAMAFHVNMARFTGTGWINDVYFDQCLDSLRAWVKELSISSISKVLTQCSRNQEVG